MGESVMGDVVGEGAKVEEDKTTNYAGRVGRAVANCKQVRKMNHLLQLCTEGVWGCGGVGVKVAA